MKKYLLISGQLVQADLLEEETESTREKDTVI